MADLIEQILSWPLDQSTNDSYDYFDYDTNNIDTANYFEAAEITGGGTPTGDGGQWNGLLNNPGYIGVKGYIQVDIEAKTGVADNIVEITSIEFGASNFFASIFTVDTFYLAYSFSSSFINPTVVYDYPEIDISAATIPVPEDISYTFPTPITIKTGETIYFRIYPYKWDPLFSLFMIIKDTFLINGIVRSASTVASIVSLEFIKDCSPSNSLTWQI